MARVLTLLEQGGPTMVPLLLCSVLALAVVLERAWALRRGRVLPAALLDLVQNFQPGTDPALSRALCARHPGALSIVISAVANGPQRDRTLAYDRAQTAGRRAVQQLDRGLVLMEIIAGVSPLLGLFGTVLGMFHTFRVIAAQGIGDASALSGGISEALLTTIVGLGVAIPTLVAHSYFSKRVDDLVIEIEEHGTTLLQRLYPEGEPPAARASARPSA